MARRKQTPQALNNIRKNLLIDATSNTLELLSRDFLIDRSDILAGRLRFDVPENSNTQVTIQKIRFYVGPLTYEGLQLWPTVYFFRGELHVALSTRRKMIPALAKRLASIGWIGFIHTPERLAAAVDSHGW